MEKRVNVLDLFSGIGGFSLGIEVPKVAGCLTGGGNSGGLHSDMTTIKVGTFRTHNDGKGFREVKSEVCPTTPARARQDGSGQPVIGAFRFRCHLPCCRETSVEGITLECLSKGCEVWRFRFRD